MRLVRLMFILFSMILFSLNSYAEKSSLMKSTGDNSKLSHTSSTDKSVDEEQENNGPDNFLKDYGPLTVCSDTLKYNANTGILVYTGNVFVMQVHDKNILCKEPLKLKKNDEYFIRNKSQPFEVLQSYWFEHAKKICDSTKECNFISGKKLTITLDKERQVKTLVMESKDGDLSQFYTYPLNTNDDYSTTKMITRGPLTGVSEDIIYDVQKRQMNLIKKARVIQHGNNYKGEKITYYMDRDLITIPGSTYKRSKIVLDGVAKQSRMNTGLTNISDYDKKDKSKQGFSAASSYDSVSTFANNAVNNNPNIQNGM